jgi:hypothetical protein
MNDYVLFYICEKAEIKDIKVQKMVKFWWRLYRLAGYLNIQGGQFLFPQVYIYSLTVMMSGEIWGSHGQDNDIVLLDCDVIFSLKMETVCLSEMLVSTNESTWCRLRRRTSSAMMSCLWQQHMFIIEHYFNQLILYRLPKCMFSSSPVLNKLTVCFLIDCFHQTENVNN